MGGESPKFAWSGHEFGHSQSRPCEPTTTPVIYVTASAWSGSGGVGRRGRDRFGAHAGSRPSVSAPISGGPISWRRAACVLVATGTSLAKGRPLPAFVLGRVFAGHGAGVAASLRSCSSSSGRSAPTHRFFGGRARARLRPVGHTRSNRQAERSAPAPSARNRTRRAVPWPVRSCPLSSGFASDEAVRFVDFVC